MRRLLAIVAAALLTAVALVLVEAPAAWLGVAVHDRSGGRVELGDARGTVWDGDAELFLAGGPGASGPGAAVPGRTAWRIRPWRLLLGTLDLTITNPAALDAPFALRLEAGSATIDANGLHLPAAILVALGAPWNTVHPGGELSLAWDTLRLDHGQLRGALRAQWAQASSVLSPVAPFGHYRLQSDGFYDGARLQLETLAGPMEMTGSGTISGGGRLRFTGLARVQPGTDPAVASQLSGLVSLLGRRGAEGAILDFGN